MDRGRNEANGNHRLGGPTMVSLPPLSPESINPLDGDGDADADGAPYYSTSVPLADQHFSSSSSVPATPAPRRSTNTPPIAIHGISSVTPSSRVIQRLANDDGGSGMTSPSPRLSSTWDPDEQHRACASCHRQFDNLFNRRHHCRLCGRVFCNDCSDTRSLIPPSALVLRNDARGGGRGWGGGNDDFASSPTTHGDDDGGECDPSLTYVGATGSTMSSYATMSHHQRQSYDDAILRGRGLEARILLARHPQRTCIPCRDRLYPLQEELRMRNSNAVRYNYVDEGDLIRRHSNSPLAFTLGHEVRKAAYALGNLLPGNRGRGRRGGAYVTLGGEYNDDGENVIYSYHPPPAEGECHVPNILASGGHGGGGCVAIDPTLRNMDGMRIPPRLLSRARGVAIVTCCKGGLGFAGFEFGTGLVVARRTDPESGPDDWSAPSAIGVAGFAWGALLGAQVSDHIFLLMTEDAVRLFASEGGRSIQLGADVGVALGPLGRSAEADLGATAGPSKGLEHDGFSGVAMAPIFTYSLSKGLYAGVSLDGRLLMTRDRVNEKFYGGAVSAHELLSGRVPNPPAAQPLYDALKRCRVYGGGEGGEGSDGKGYIYGSRNFGEEGYDPLEQLSHTTGMGIPATSLSAESRYFSPRNLYNLNARENFTPGLD